MNKLETAIKLRTEKKFKDAETLFLELLENNSQNAYVHYHYPWTLDNQGKEKEAIKHYKKALKNNLDKEFKADCYLGLGSSYRMIKKYKKSVKIFDKAILEFPNNQALKLFRTMSLFKQKKYKKSYLECLQTLLEVNSNVQIKALSVAINNFVKQNNIDK